MKHATFYGINQFKANYYVEAGISMQLFNKLGKLSLVANDIFKPTATVHQYQIPKP
jgi:iron complex outermembrane receptor protein